MEKENLIVGEQPNTAEVQAVETGVVEGTEMREGSPLGKFKNSESLLGAYNELQSEFTRKCQKLSEAEKKLQDLSCDNDASKLSQQDNEEFAWKQNIGEFLQSHKNARTLVEEITNEIMKDEGLRKSSDGLEKAYSRVIENKYIPQEELAKDQDFLEKYIYTNDEIKNKIIKEYISTLQNGKSPLSVGKEGYNRGVVSTNKIESLDDAKKYVESMFRF
ncbi:MAG: hypothetical protein IJW59_01900 [Clostridia bacterium]|nr:hypothetical protein [Clostridia bacterium]